MARRRRSVPARAARGSPGPGRRRGSMTGAGRTAAARAVRGRRDGGHRRAVHGYAVAASARSRCPTAVAGRRRSCWRARRPRGCGPGVAATCPPGWRCWRRAGSGRRSGACRTRPVPGARGAAGHDPVRRAASSLNRASACSSGAGRWYSGPKSKTRSTWPSSNASVGSSGPRRRMSRPILGPLAASRRRSAGRISSSTYSGAQRVKVRGSPRGSKLPWAA